MAGQLSGRVEPGAVQDSLSSIIGSKFSAANRLLRADGFDHVMRAESIADKQFKIFFTRNFKDNARLGIIASKKSLPSAVKRNRVKRFIRETFRLHNIRRCRVDVVVMLSRGHFFTDYTRNDNLKLMFSQVEHRCAE